MPFRTFQFQTYAVAIERNSGNAHTHTNTVMYLFFKKSLPAAVSCIEWHFLNFPFQILVEGSLELPKSVS